MAKRSLSSSFSNSAKSSEEAFMQALDAAAETGDVERILEIFNTAPAQIQNNPFLALYYAGTLIEMAEFDEALHTLLEIERKNPRFIEIYLPLASLYYQNTWPALALYAAQRALTIRHIGDEERAMLTEIIRDATNELESLAAEANLIFETMRRASMANEHAQRALMEERFSEADYFCREAIKFAPNWNPPHNNRARALYFSGKCENAIAVLEGVVARDPENMFALNDLVTDYVGLGQLERAHDYAARLAQMVNETSSGDTGLDYVITALAMVEDTPTLWKFAQHCCELPGEDLLARTWMCLAVAAVRTGNWKMALDLISKPEEEELPPGGTDLLDELKLVAARPHPRLAWMPPAYPGADLLLHPKVMAEWDALAPNGAGVGMRVYQRKLAAFLKKYPFVIVGMGRLLWAPFSSSLFVPALVEMNHPNADAELFRFALSQAGSREARTQALFALTKTGRYNGAKTVKIWDENQEEWQTLELTIREASSQ